MISHSFDRFVLSNGLRVVVAPDDTAPVAAISVHYDVGYRSEPESRSGFAHLFEHLMFGGSESVPHMEHARIVNATGGTFNGATSPDFTTYFDVVPVEALETALFLEADRMRAPRLDEAELRKQTAVVKEEIRTSALSNPYGRFPSRLTAVLYDNFANTHDGWGDFESLEQATLDDCLSFFDTYYAPSNAVLTVSGAVTTDQVEQLVRRHFDDVPARPRPQRPELDEPHPSTDRRADVPTPHIPLTAAAIGYRMPDPARIDDYLAVMVLGDVLTEGANARLQRRLVHTGLAQHVDATPLGGPFFCRHPDTWRVAAYLAPSVTPEQISEALDEELAQIAQHPPAAEEIARSVTRWTTAVHAQCDDPSQRIIGLGLFELLHGQAELLPRMPKRLAGVDPDAVSAAAKALTADNRAVYVLHPSGGLA